MWFAMILCGDLLHTGRIEFVINTLYSFPGLTYISLFIISINILSIKLDFERSLFHLMNGTRHQSSVDLICVFFILIDRSLYHQVENQYLFTNLKTGLHS